MHFIRLIPAVLLAVGVALSAPPADDAGKAASTPSANAPERTTDPNPSIPGIHALPPVLRNTDKEDSVIVMLPGAAAPAPVQPAAPVPDAGPPPEDPDRPILRRSAPTYPAEFGAESALFCQKQIGAWTLEDTADVLGEAKGHRPSLDDDGVENGDIYAFSDPSSRYRELELDFDRESGTLRTVFAYPWKMSWQDCRKIWGARVNSTDADKGRTFYSYLDRRLDVLVDQTGKVISFGLY
jgi:hypothetical protein